jgi:hypothetical protein
MTVDISKIKRGDMVTLYPLEVRFPGDNIITVILPGDAPVSYNMNVKYIAAHHPHEIGVGDRVKVAPANPALIAGTVEHIARGKARVIWDNGDDTLYSVSDLTVMEGDQ